MNTIIDDFLGKIKINTKKKKYNDYLKKEFFRTTKNGIKVVAEYYDKKTKKLIISFEQLFERSRSGKSSYYMWSNGVGYGAMKHVGDPNRGGSITSQFPGTKSLGYDRIEKMFGII